jgi:transcriptional regulator with XRE-family HTH domain
VIDRWASPVRQRALQPALADGATMRAPPEGLQQTTAAPSNHLGQRLRATRRAKNQTLKELASLTGFTEAYLSQVENGRTSPTLASLKKIATAYELSVVELLADEPPANSQIVLRREQRRNLISGAEGMIKEMLVGSQNGKRMEPLLVTINPLEGSGGQYNHAGEEFGMVLGGTLELSVEDNVFRVRKGDTFYFTSTRMHGFRNPSPRSKAVVLWVITPPTF